MSRICDNCKKVIPLGSDYIEVKFIGVKEAEKLFKSSSLDFCGLTCLASFWSNQKNLVNEK